MKNRKLLSLALSGLAAAGLLAGVACDSEDGTGNPGSTATEATASSPAGAATARPSATQATTQRTGSEMSTADLVKLAEPSIVRIETAGGVGSGFVVHSDGYIMTNNHVVTTSGRAAGTILVTMSDGTEYRATIVGRDTRSDLALLKVDATGLSALEFAPLSEVAVGQDVVAIGYALDLEGGEGPSYTVTRGIVSAKNRAIQEQVAVLGAVQTDAAINHGNSGGPLLDLYGRVIGINTAVDEASVVAGGTATGIGYAVGSDIVKAVYEEILENGKVNRGLLGIQYFEALRPAKAKELGVPVELGGVYLQDKENQPNVPSGPAAAAGIREGDVIVRINDIAVRTETDLAIAMIHHAPGEKVEVEVYRDGKSQTFTVTLGSQTQ